jgi:DNA repair protein RadD
VDVLTTGFDAPGIDAVAVLRATMSPGLFAQIVGRGLRIADGKTDCLILDFGGNLQRHGALDADDYGIEKPREKDGTAEVLRKCKKCGFDNRRRARRCIKCYEQFLKSCPKCRADVDIAATDCPECGHVFVAEMDNGPRHSTTIDTTSAIIDAPHPKWYDVEEVQWHLHKKRGADDKPPTLCVSYQLSDEALPDAGNLSWITVREWVCFDHQGYALQKAFGWWFARSAMKCPASVAEAITAMNRGACRKPSRMLVQKEGKWDKIVRVEFIEDRPTMVKELTTAANEFDKDCPF